MNGEAGAFAGFWEQAVFLEKGLQVAGWAVRRDTGEGPDCFLFTCGSGASRFRPDLMREDVGRMIGRPATACGFETVLPVEMTIDDDWSRPCVVALWGDGTGYALPPLTTDRGNHFCLLEGRGFEAFQRAFQNPATRIRHPLVQAYGARRALRQAGGDHMLWMAAAVVALYRQLEGGHFPRAEAELVLSEWRDRQAALPAEPEGELMRWVIATHLAAGYVYFTWGMLDRAEAEFAAILGCHRKLSTWPQAVGTLGIGMFMAGWMAWRRGDAQSARAVLAPSDRLVQDGAEALRIWSWHHFEELRNALNIAQLCFTLLKRIELGTVGVTWPSEAEPTIRLAGSAWLGSILPAEATLSLAAVSGVLERLVRAGAVEDGPFPPMG